MILKPILALSLLLCSASFLMGSNTHANNNSQYAKALSYIDLYKDIAIKEMQRTGIPASIKLAQGILESGFGESKLALEANNHFGIKCKSGWTGATIYQDDDTTKECFRKYPSVIESYMDHSMFLTSRSHYDFLFALPPADYVAWAEGLKKAGYATNPNYSKLLITTIETYNLHTYDNIYTKPIVYAENICLNGKGEWVVINLPKNQMQELGLDLPASASVGGFADIFVTGDLVYIDDMLNQAAKKRPQGTEFKCLKGMPAVSIQPERLRATFKSVKNQGILLGLGGGNNGTKTAATTEPGRQLNPTFNPAMHLPLAAFNQNTAPTETPAANLASTTVTNPQPATKTTTTTTTQQAVAYAVVTPDTPKTATTANTTPTQVAEKPAAPIVETEKKPALTEKTKVTYAEIPQKVVSFKPDMSKEDLMLPNQKSYHKNGVKAVAYAYAVLPSQIAQTYKLSLTEVLAFNDLQNNEPIPAKTNIFLAAKKDKNESAEKQHTVKPNETLWQIAQLYGINLNALCLLNKITPMQEPPAGTVLQLRKSGVQMPRFLDK